MTVTTGRSASAAEWRNWPVLVPSLAGITLVAVHGYSLGVLIHPLEQEFGWSRTVISAGPLLISMLTLLASPIVGVCIDRFGPRRVAIVGISVYCCGLATMSTITGSLVSWWLHWAMLAVGTAMILPTVWTAAINSLFSINRGKALAFALIGTGLSAAVVPIVTDALVRRGGWREAYLALAGGGAIIALPLVLLFFRGATDMRRGVASSPVAALTGMSARAGFRSPAFVKLAAAVLLFGVTSLALTINAVPILVSQGFATSTAAKMAGLIGLGSIAGRLGGGFLLDRIDAKLVAAAASCSPVVTVVLYTFFSGSPWPVAAGSFILGLSLGTEVDACSYLAARHFGMRSFGTLFGTINGIVAFGTGLAPVIANRVYDLTGSYHAILISVVPGSFVAVALFLSLGRYPGFAGADAVAASGEVPIDSVPVASPLAG